MGANWEPRHFLVLVGVLAAGLGLLLRADMGGAWYLVAAGGLIAHAGLVGIAVRGSFLDDRETDARH